MQLRHTLLTALGLSRVACGGETRSEDAAVEAGLAGSGQCTDPKPLPRGYHTGIFSCSEGYEHRFSR